MAELSAEWLTALSSYAQGFREEAQVAAGKAAEHLVTEVRDKARITPGWETMADEIEVWSQDGILIVGVQNDEFVSQAFALEYGDETTPPTPLFRTSQTVVDEAGEIYSTHLADMGMGDRHDQ